MKWFAGRGYRPTGERNPNARLTAAKVIEIRRAMVALVVAEIGKPMAPVSSPVRA